MIQPSDLAAQAIEAIQLQREGFGLRAHMGPSITFRNVTYQVTRGVFVPQPVSEQLVEGVLDAISQAARPTIVDVGTGCGAIALSVARERPDALVIATDASSRATKCARINASTMGLRTVEFKRGSLLRPLPKGYMGKVNAIASNLPYVPHHVGAAAPSPSATRSYTSRDPLRLPIALAVAARPYLLEGGYLLTQLFEYQIDSFASAVAALQYGSMTIMRPSGSRSAIVSLTR
jgi:release factor glutamine methyltransferase